MDSLIFLGIKLLSLSMFPNIVFEFYSHHNRHSWQIFFAPQNAILKTGLSSVATRSLDLQDHKRTAIYMTLDPPKFWEQLVDDVYSIIKSTHLENFFHSINCLHQKVKFTMEVEGNGELALLGILLKRNNGKISLLVYRKPTHTDQYLHLSSHHQTSCKGSFVSS